jgi:hypothetical protein
MKLTKNDKVGLYFSKCQAHLHLLKVKNVIQLTSSTINQFPWMIHFTLTEAFSPIYLKLSPET